MASKKKNEKKTPPPARPEIQAASGVLPPEPKGIRRQCWQIFIFTFIVYLLPLGVFTSILQLPPDEGHFLLTKSRADSWNDQARVATVESLAERHTFAIEHSKWGWFTGDKVLLREHFYSTKPPLLSAVGAVSYMIFRTVVKGVTGHEITYLHNEDIIYPWVTLTTSVLGFALLLVYFFRALYLVDMPEKARSWLFWALAIGTLYPAYSTVINNHTVAGTGNFIAFYYVARYRLTGSIKWWEILLAGIAAGFAGVTDITGSLPLAILFLFLIFIHDFPLAGTFPKRALQKGFIAAGLFAGIAAISILALWLGNKGMALLLFGPLTLILIAGIYLASKKYPVSILYLIGLLLPVIVHLFLNSRVTGNWLPTYVQSDVYIAAPPGYFGEVLSPEESGALYWARWKYIGTALFGIRGIFIYTPTLLVGLISAVVLIFKKGDNLRLDAVAVAIAVLIGWGYVLLFSSPNFGGTSYGVRYALAASPLLIFFSYRIFTDWNIEWVKLFFRNAVVWGAIVGLIAIPYPWGIFGQLPSTQCSIIQNLQHIALYTLSALK